MRILILTLSLFMGWAHAGDKVVYHIDDAAAQATKGLRNIRNHLDVLPDTQIVVVTHANGVDFLMEGAKDPKNPSIDYAALVSALKSRGVRFEVCEITLRNRSLKKEQFIMDADYTRRVWPASVPCSSVSVTPTSNPESPARRVSA